MNGTIKQFCLLFIGILVLTAPGFPDNKSVPRQLIPRIIRIIPHDHTAYVQGLVWADGLIYESNGLYNRSSLRIINGSTGAILKTMVVPEVFAEGLTIYRNSLVQLTWREQIALRYRLDGSPQGSFSYVGEGWGITTAGNTFIMSNGSDTLFVRDSTFAVIKRIAVTSKGAPLFKLNELEFVNQTVYANVWYDNRIALINATTGVVKAFVDCQSLVRKANVNVDGAVLNGIAYMPGSKTFLLTGKLWPMIFEVALDQ